MKHIDALKEMISMSESVEPSREWYMTPSNSWAGYIINMWDGWLRIRNVRIAPCLLLDIETSSSFSKRYHYDGTLLLKSISYEGSIEEFDELFHKLWQIHEEL